MVPAVRRLAGLLSRRTGARACSGEEALAAGSLIYLNSIKMTENMWEHGSELTLGTAARRYQSFVELPGRSVPTRDISLVWAAQMLHPSSYKAPKTQSVWYEHEQFRLLRGRELAPVEPEPSGPFGRLKSTMGSMFTRRPVRTGVEAFTVLDAFDANGDGVVSKEERQIALSHWEAAYRRTADVWHEKFGTAYRVPDDELPRKCHKIKSGATTHLDSAVQRQAAFNRRILKLGPAMITPVWIQTAVGRYSQFLALAKDNPGVILVPTLDVDLVWHAHMLSPADYQEDCQQLLGRLLSHNDALAAGEIETSFKATKALWQQRFGSPYVQERKEGNTGTAVGGSGCASCGWGDSHMHRALGHDAVEAQIVEAASSGAELSFDAASSGGEWSSDAQTPESGAQRVLSLGDSNAATPESGGGSWFPFGGDGGDSGSVSGCGSGCGGGCGGG
uniref:Uncharacterized protein n=1 Tax=Alexandrium catenella TaxID=2925 RepID=A0A7S1QN65_ALECA|mmetsp:Transcript_35588/g.96508  ORF Transcript_35588/g.96508 Transcript_35588/m.96508 type:complete len:447 (+) Transcript_35588:81-1421(+)